MSAPDRRQKLDRAHSVLSIRRQCVLLSLARSGVYRFHDMRHYPLAGSSIVRISTSDFSVRCTGHLSAISMSCARCSALRSPLSITTRSIRSSIPAFVSHSAQSAA